MELSLDFVVPILDCKSLNLQQPKLSLLEMAEGDYRELFLNKNTLLPLPSIHTNLVTGKTIGSEEVSSFVVGSELAQDFKQFPTLASVDL